jgi:hypothetical protein
MAYQAAEGRRLMDAVYRVALLILVVLAIVWLLKELGWVT